MKSGLNPKQQAFIREYLVDLNATQAAIRAGYSRKAAEVQGWRMLRNAKVQALIAEKQADTARRLDITRIEVLRETACIGFSDPRQLFNDNGGILDPKNWPDRLASAIASIEVFEEYRGTGERRKYIGRTKKVKFWDKNAALDKLCRHLGLYGDDNRQRHSLLPDDITAEEAEFIRETLGKLLRAKGLLTPSGAVRSLPARTE